MDVKIQELRKEYLRAELDEKSVATSPFSQFAKWFEEAARAQSEEPNAAVLSTVADDGGADARAVLLKGFSEKGFVFFTSYESPKAAQIERQPLVSLLFLWLELERQVRIRGNAEKLPHAASQEYFATRPRGSQVGALCFKQSQEVLSRTELDERFRCLQAELEGKPITCPEHWGGYVVKPSTFEFWQGRENRLHDRILYRMQSDGIWRITRLAP